MAIVQNKQTIPVAFPKNKNAQEKRWSNNKSATVAQSWSRPTICIDWTGIDQTISLRIWQYKSCINVSDLDIQWWAWFTCSDVEDCQVIQDIITDINNLQNSTTQEAIQDAVFPLLVHWNHVWLTAVYDDPNNQIILTVTWWSWFTCNDVANCITNNINTQTALLNWLESLTNVNLTWDWVFNWTTTFNWDVNNNNNTITYNNSDINFENWTTLNYDSTVVSNHNGDTVNYDWSTVNSTNTTYNHDNDTFNIDNSTINSTNNTYNHTGDTINYDATTTVDGGTFNNNTFNNPTFTWSSVIAGALVTDYIPWNIATTVYTLSNIPSWTIQVSTQGWVIQVKPSDYTHTDNTITFTGNVNRTGLDLIVTYIKWVAVTAPSLKVWPITRTPAWSSFTHTNALSTATSVVNGISVTSWTVNWNYFDFDTSIVWQITFTSKDFLWNSVSENGIVFYYTVNY